MRVFITGGTGFIGRALVQRLLRDGHRITVWTRDPERARFLLGPDVRLLAVGEGQEALKRALGNTDGVINLAGESLIGGRWSPKKKDRLLESRLETTRQLVDAMARLRRRPRVLVSASAVGYYGSRGTAPVDEASTPGRDFLAELCRRWEKAARRASRHRVRVVTLRHGLVLGPEGGVVQKLFPLFKLGLGARMGSGRQYLSWIHLYDMVELISTVLRDRRFSGPVNATAPWPVTNREFTRALGDALGRRAVLSVPAGLLRLAMGEAASTVLKGQRVLPRRARERGFKFRYPKLDQALRAIFLREQEPEFFPDPVVPEGFEVNSGRPRYLLKQSTVVDAPVEEVFAFFSRAENLGLLTPSWTSFRIEGEPPRKMGEGTVLDYRLKLGPLPLRWRTGIDKWEPARRFVDSQLRGPYRLWWHEHRFIPQGKRTRMEDKVYYSLPLGFLGRLAHDLFVRRALRRIFGYRAVAIGLRFGSVRG
jgi:uncharacterized protein (TIGR01777 family)